MAKHPPLNTLFAFVIIFENINFDNIFSFVPKYLIQIVLLFLYCIYNFPTAEKYVQFFYNNYF